MKRKNYLYIIILILLIIIAFLGYKLLEKNDEQVANNLPNENENVQANNLPNENQNTNLGDGQEITQEKFSSTQNYNIELNGKIAEVNVKINIDEEYKSENYATLETNNEREQKVDLSIKINGKQVALEESTLYPTMGMNDQIKISDIIQEVSTIKGQDNKSYIKIVILEKDYDTHDRKNCYVIDENAEVIGVFNYKLGSSIQVEDYSGELLDVNEDNIIEYEYKWVDGENKLYKWKYTIKDGKVEKQLEKQYAEDEYTGAGAR